MGKLEGEEVVVEISLKGKTKNPKTSLGLAKYLFANPPSLPTLLLP